MAEQTENEKLLSQVSESKPVAIDIARDQLGHYSDNAPQADNMRHSPSHETKKPFKLGGK